MQASHTGGARTHKRVQHHITRLAISLDQPLQENSGLLRGMQARIATGIAAVGKVQNAAGVTLTADGAEDRRPGPLPAVVRHRAGLSTHVGLMPLFFLRLVSAALEPLGEDKDVLMRPQGPVVEGRMDAG